MKSVHRQYDYSGGVNTTDTDDSILPNQFAGGQNLRFAGRGLKQRLGQTKLNTNAVSGAGKVASLFRFYKDDGTTRFTVGNSGTALYSWAASPSAITRTSGTWTSGASLGGAVMNNSLFLMDGTSNPQKWTGTGSTTDMAGTPPTNANLLIAHPTSNRLFTLSGKTLTWSALGNPEDWTTANDAGFALIPFSEGENGKAMLPTAQGTLLIFSNSSTHTLTGTSLQDFARRELDPAIGCRAPRSLAAGDGGVFFLAQNSRVYFNNGTKNIYIGREIQGTLDAGSVGDYPNAVGWVEGTRYHLSFASTSGNNDSELVYDWSVAGTNKKAWLPADKSKAIASVAVDDGLNQQVYTGDYAGFVQQQDVGTTDNGTAIASYIDTKFDSYDEPERRKKTKRTYVKFVPSGAYNMAVSVAKDGGSLLQQGLVTLAVGGAVLDSVSYGLDSLTTALDGGKTEQVTRVSAIKNARSIKHRFAVSGPFRFLGYSTILIKKTLK